MTLSKIVSIVESTEMRKGEPRNSPSTLFAMNDTTNHIIADPTILMQGNAMSDTITHGFLQFPKSLINDKDFKSWPVKYKWLFFKFIEWARFTPCDYNDHGVSFRLEVGQFCNTIRGVLAEMGDEYTRYDIEKFLKMDKNEKFFRQEIKNKKSVITITHSDTYKLLLSQSLGENLRQDFRQDFRQENKDLKQSESDTYEGSKQKSQTGFQTGFQTQLRHKAIKNTIKKATTSKEESVDAAAAFFSESYDFLVQFGVAKKTAKELATHPLAFIKEKHSLVMARKNISNPVGWLINAIERDYPVAKAECPASVKAFRKRLVLDLQERELIVKVISDKLRFNDHVVDLNQSISDIIDHVNKSLINNKLNKNDYANY